MQRLHANSFYLVFLFLSLKIVFFGISSFILKLKKVYREAEKEAQETVISMKINNRRDSN